MDLLQLMDLLQPMNLLLQLLQLPLLTIPQNISSSSNCWGD